MEVMRHVFLIMAPGGCDVSIRIAPGLLCSSGKEHPTGVGGGAGIEYSHFAARTISAHVITFARACAQTHTQRHTSKHIDLSVFVANKHVPLRIGGGWNWRQDRVQLRVLVLVLMKLRVLVTQN
jgi:hypothetical protein